jgi:Coenzyme PQQ synthesis protein D (PqqD)
MSTKSTALPDGMATVFALAPHASFQLLEDGAVILDGESGQLYSCNEVTGAFLSRIDGRSSLEEIASEILATFDVDAQTARDDLMDIAGKLHAEKLIQTV